MLQYVHGDFLPLEPGLDPPLELGRDPFPLGDGLRPPFFLGDFSSFFGEGDLPFLLFPDGEAPRSSFLVPFLDAFGDTGFAPLTVDLTDFASGSGLGGTSGTGSGGTSGFGSA